MQLRRALTVAIAVSGVIALSACSAGETPAPADAAGAAPASSDLTLSTAEGDVTLEAVPQSVVVFDYASLDTLQTLGLQDVVVGTPVKNLPEALSAFSTAADVGQLKEPDVEAVANLAPDLIIVSGRTAGSDAYPELQAIAPTVNVSSDDPDWLAGATDRAVDLAGVFGKQAEAQTKVDEIVALKDEVAQQGAGAGTGLFVTLSGGKISAYGSGSRFGMIHDQLGIAPAAEISAEESHGQEISYEFIAEKNPGVLVVMDRDSAIGSEGAEGAGAQALDNELVNSTDAAKNGKIIFVDSGAWYLITGGLTTTKAMIQEIGDGLA